MRTSILLCGLTLVLSVDPPRLCSQDAGEAKPSKEELADRKKVLSQFRQIAIAMHNYHDRHKAFPPAMLVDRKQRELLSWRVLILPYLGEEKLFREFNLEEPWDSPHNKTLLAKRPKAYAPVRKDAGADMTYYQVFHGKDAAFERQQPLRIDDLLDGTANTFLLAEAANAVPWSKPADLAYDPKKPLPKLGAQFDKVFAVGIGDGTSALVKSNADERILQLYIMRNDGQSIPRNDIFVTAPD